MAMQKIGKMSLKNQGGFTAQISFSYVDDEGEKKFSGHTGDILLGQSKIADPGDLGIPDGTLIRMYVLVDGGQANEARRAFVYEKGNPATAHYVISGTTLNNDLALIEMNEWTNWAGNLSAVPNSLLQPTSVAELQNIVTQNQGSTIRVAGTGHSWTPLCVTSDVLVDANGITENGRKAWRWQKGNLNLVTFLPSARWADVRNALTDPSNPAPRMYLPTAGVLPSINATGFVAAGCHGTGWNQPTVSDLIYAIEIVAGDGKVHVFSEETTPNEMNTVRVNVGTLGIISKVTLKVEPMYRLWDQELILSTAEVLGPNPASNGGQVDPTKLSARVTGNEYVELFWFPWSGGGLTITDGAMWVKQYNRTQEDPRDVPLRPPDWQAWMGELVMEQIAENAAGPPASVIVPPFELLVWQQLSESIRSIEKTNGFISDAPRVLHYQETAFSILDLEIAIPIPATGPTTWDFTNVVKAWYAVVNYVRDQSTHEVYPLTCCLHARFTSNSQALLSPAYEPAGSNTHYCWMEILSAYPKTEPNPDKRNKAMVAYENLANAVVGPLWVSQMHGRPHWSKYWQHLPNLDIKSLYPQANRDQFNKLRRQLDPAGMFLNPFLKGLNLFV